MSVESHNKGIVYYPNKAVNVSPAHDSIVHACNHVALNENGDTGQSAELQTDNELGNMFMIQYDPAIKVHSKITPAVATTHTQTTSFSNTAMIDVEPSENDINLLNADPTLVRQLLDGNTTGLSFLAENVKHYYPCNDYESGKYIQDVIVPIGSNITNDWYSSSGGQTITEIPNGHNAISTSSSSSSGRPALGRRFNSYIGYLKSTIKVTVNSGIAHFRYRTLGGGIATKAYNITLPVGVYYYTSIDYTDGSTLSNAIFDGQAEITYDITVEHFIYPMEASEIIGYTDNCRDYFKNVNYGLSNTRVVQDSTGRLLSMTDPYTANYTTDGRTIKPNVKPNLDVMSIREVVRIPSGVEDRVHVWDDVLLEEAYYINGILQVTSPPELVSQFVLNSSGRLLSYSYINGEDHATLEDNTADADGYLIIDMVTEIGKEYVVSVLPDVVSTPLQSYYKNRIVIDAVQIPLSNQGTVLKQELEFVATETITPLYLYAADVTIIYSEISLKEKAIKVVPARPDKDTIIVLGNTAVVGNPDVITERKGNFQLSSVMWTEQKIIDKHNDFIRKNYTVVLHDGEEVTHNGILVYTI